MNVGVVGNRSYDGLAAILSGMAARAQGLGIRLHTEPDLAPLWEEPLPPIGVAELDAIRSHIKRTRAALAAERVNSLPMHLIAAQKGMFSTLPLSEAQVVTLRDQHGIYMTDSARINVAGLREADIPRFVEALRAVA
mgnify:CR=1 FL=1